MFMASTCLVEAHIISRMAQRKLQERVWYLRQSGKPGMQVCVAAIFSRFMPDRVAANAMPCRPADFNVTCLPRRRKRALRELQYVFLDHHGGSIDRTSERRADDGRLPESSCPACPLCLPACLRAHSRCCCAADRALLQCCCHACMYARTRGGAGWTVPDVSSSRWDASSSNSSSSSRLDNNGSACGRCCE
jgi:hypothetical protein